jgi:hypothetical protein
LSRTSPKTQNTSRAFPHQNKRSHGTTETSLLKNPSRQPTGRNCSDRFGKPVRPVFAWTVGKNTARGKNSTLPPIDLPIHSTDQSETLGINGVPRGLPLARSSVPKTHSIKRNRKSTLTNTSNPRTPTTEIETLNSQIWEGNHIPKNHEGFPQISPIKSPRARSRKQHKNNREQHIQT